jgi:formamidopyrimidine-DNA glycosylase
VANTPITYRDHLSVLLVSLNRVISGYIRGQLLLSLIIAALVGAGMWLLGVPNPLFLAVVAFVFEFVPMVGLWIIGAVCVVVALSQGWTIALLALGYFVLASTFEADIASPRILGRAVHVHPVVSLFALLAGAEMFGLWGALFAAPAAGLAQALGRTYWAEWRAAHPREFPEDAGMVVATSDPPAGTASASASVRSARGGGMARPSRHGDERRMAELPEVETTVRDLRAAIVGCTIEGAEVLRPEVVRFTTPADFAHEIAGASVTQIDRRGKWILVRLSGERTLAIHFMLFGRLRLEPHDAPREKNLLLALTLDDGEQLRLIDRLGYARVALMPSAELEGRLGLGELGPEVLDDDFTPEALEIRLAKKRTPLKPALLDQHVVAGMGNRDADESLWRAGISPRRPAKELSHEETEHLTTAMQAVLREGIARRGTMPDLWGRRGTQMSHRDIFERAGQPCPRCGTPIERIEQSGRQTFYCPVCQG